MKINRLFTLLLLLGVLVAAANGPTGKADVTVEFCDSQFGSNMLACQNVTGYPGDPSCPGDPDCHMYPNCTFSADMMHYSCMGSIPATPDFCALARWRAANCSAYDPMTDFLNYSDCMTKSGIQFCE